MNVEELKQEIERKNLDTRFINIGSRGNFDECFNLLELEDGRWEIFYGEHGQKTNPVVYDTQEAAVDAFLKDIYPLLGKRHREAEKFINTVSKFSSVYAICFLVFCILFFAFLSVVCFDPTSWVFWALACLTVILTIVTLRCLRK